MAALKATRHLRVSGNPKSLRLSPTICESTDCHREDYQTKKHNAISASAQVFAMEMITPYLNAKYIALIATIRATKTPYARKTV
jgi:hypothetical protein